MPYLPELRAHLDRLLADRERVLADSQQQLPELRRPARSASARVACPPRPFQSGGQPDALFTTVQSTRTTSTGYYYAYWIARRDVNVCVAYFSPCASVQRAFATQGLIDVR